MWIEAYVGAAGFCDTNALWRQSLNDPSRTRNDDGARVALAPYGLAWRRAASPDRMVPLARSHGCVA
eukprot:8767595-Alexandrium_andersonii.AAC.1